MKYYIAENGSQVGPMEENELTQHGLTVNSLVWREGMSEWTNAGSVPELSYLLGQEIPPQPEQQAPQTACPPQQTPLTPMPKTWLVESILVTLLCCLPFGIIGIINASKVSSQFAMGDHAGAAESSKQAGKWTKLGFIIGLGGVVLYIALYVAIIVFSINTNI